MTGRGKRALGRLLAGAVAVAWPAAGLAQAVPGPRIALELNKLEAAPSGCRAYFLAENGTPELVKELRLDTFIFDKAGVIARRIGLTFPDLRPNRAKVVPFDLAGSACPEIGRLLVNDILACTGGLAAIPNCGELLATTSRAGVALDY